MSHWYTGSLFLLHYDHPFSSSGAPDPVAGLDPEQVRRLLAQVRPDALQYTAKGHAGYVPYPTRYGNALPSTELYGLDLLNVYREATSELGIHFILGYSGLVDYRAADTRTDWQRRRADGSPYPNRALCPNNGYVDELMLPQLDELLARYQPAGVWTDADNWTVSPCYCAGCEAEFQLLHSRLPPRDRSESFWAEWLEFHRDSFNRYLSRVARYLHERSDNLAYTSNSACSSHQPETVPSGMDRLTRDLSPAFSLRQAGLEARFLGSHGVPFDLMTWNRASARPWPQGRLPALPAYPKTFEHLAQEGAAILANGGRWTAWMSVSPDGTLPDAEHGVVAQAAEFTRARQAWLQGTASAAFVAVLHSEGTHRRTGNGLYDPGPSLDRIRGAHQALQELHYPHDIVTEEGLLRELERYDLVVIPEQIAFPPALDEALADWVHGGGRLLATGRVSPRIVEDLPTFALEEVLGVQWTGQTVSEGQFLHRGRPLRIAAPVHHVSTTSAQAYLPLLRSASGQQPEESGYPGVTRRHYGEGEAWYIAADFFTAYHRCQYPGFRELLGDLLEQALPHPALTTTAPPTVEVTVRTRDGQVLVHLVNLAPGKSLSQNSAFIESVPPSAPFTVTLSVGREPAEVRLQPGGVEPEWSHADGALTVSIPSVHLHTVLVVSG